MSLRDTLTAVLARYDDDTWTAVANRGLLRRARKDLASTDVRVLAEDDAHVDVGVGDLVVRVGPTGPAAATCTCPSPVTCQHVLTACLWLAASGTGGSDASGTATGGSSASATATGASGAGRLGTGAAPAGGSGEDEAAASGASTGDAARTGEQPGDARRDSARTDGRTGDAADAGGVPDDATGGRAADAGDRPGEAVREPGTRVGTSGEADASDPTDVLHADLMALDAAALTAAAGLPGYRWAHQLLDDADEPPVLTRTGYLAVTFPRRGITARYLGGGLDAVVLDETVPHPVRYRVAAVLAWQRAHGLTLPAPPRPRARTSAPSESAVSRAASRERLRATVAAVLRDTVRVGMSHLSPALHERVATAAVWAQGVEYHRLALLLRRVADDVELLLSRSARADDRALLDDVATAYALVTALSATAGREPAALVGRARSAYDPVRRLDLVGLGGRPWRTGSGYHGLTCVFWDTARGRTLTWTDARPVTLTGFDPQARWTQPGPWTGLGAPSRAAGASLVLTNAQLSDGGRLSGVEATSAAVAELTAEDLLSRVPVRTSWGELAVRGVTGLLDVPDPTAGWTVLRPAAALPARWDAVAQTLRWPLLDESDDVLVLEVPWSRLHAHVVGRLEALTDGLPDGACVVAHVRRVRGDLVGEPLSLVVPGADRPLDALHFDPAPHPTTPPRAGARSLVAELLARGDADRPTSLPPDDTPVVVPAPLAAVRAVLEQVAQRGCAGTAPGDVHRQVATVHAAARAVGLTVLGEPDPTLDPAEVVLRSAYLVQQVEHALG